MPAQATYAAMRDSLSLSEHYWPCSAVDSFPPRDLSPPGSALWQKKKPFSALNIPLSTSSCLGISTSDPERWSSPHYTRLLSPAVPVSPGHGHDPLPPQHSIPGDTFRGPACHFVPISIRRWQRGAGPLCPPCAHPSIPISFAALPGPPTAPCWLPWSPISFKWKHKITTPPSLVMNEVEAGASSTAMAGTVTAAACTTGPACA